MLAKLAYNYPLSIHYMFVHMSLRSSVASLATLPGSTGPFAISLLVSTSSTLDVVSLFFYLNLSAASFFLFCLRPAVSMSISYKSSAFRLLANSYLPLFLFALLKKSWSSWLLFEDWRICFLPLRLAPALGIVGVSVCVDDIYSCFV